MKVLQMIIKDSFLYGNSLENRTLNNVEAAILTLFVSYRKFVIVCFYNFAVKLCCFVFKMTTGSKPLLNAFVVSKKVDFEVYVLVLPELVTSRTKSNLASRIVSKSWKLPFRPLANSHLVNNFFCSFQFQTCMIFRKINQFFDNSLIRYSFIFCPKCKKFFTQQCSTIKDVKRQSDTFPQKRGNSN